jgi:hypothetical protein
MQGILYYFSFSYSTSSWIFSGIKAFGIMISSVLSGVSLL